jgi:hypothetical protein
LILLRFGPRQPVEFLEDEDGGEAEAEENGANEEDELLGPERDYQSIRSLRAVKSGRKGSVRLRASLGGMV